MRSVLVSLLSIAACTSPRNSPTVTRAPTAIIKRYPAPLYAGLFVKGTRHTYAVESAHSHWDDQDPRADRHGNVEERFTSSRTCTVTDVRELPQAIASRIECEDTDGDPMVSDAPAGIYVASADGLWSVPEMPRVAPTTSKYRLFASPPVAGAIDEPDPQNPDWGTRTTVSQNGAGGWCRYVTFISGDEGDEQICVGDGIIVSGSASSAGGSSYEMSYALAGK